MSNIRFFQREGQTLPMQLTCFVDDTRVLYWPNEDYYLFYVDEDNKKLAMKVVKQIINCIQNEQSDGRVWFTDSIEIVDHKYGLVVIKWKYHTKYSIKTYKIVLSNLLSNEMKSIVKEYSQDC